MDAPATSSSDRHISLDPSRPVDSIHLPHCYDWVEYDNESLMNKAERTIFGQPAHGSSLIHSTASQNSKIVFMVDIRIIGDSLEAHLPENTTNHNRPGQMDRTTSRKSACHLPSPMNTTFMRRVWPLVHTPMPIAEALCGKL